MTLVIGVAVVLGLGALGFLLVRGLGAFLAIRGTRVVVCPENREMVAVEVDAARAVRSALGGQRELRLADCTRWPEKAGCGQECLAQIEAAPEACLLRHILTEWYGDKACALCGRRFGEIHWHDHKPALLGPGDSLVEWSAFPPERVLETLATHRPVCWDCRVAESFRREHPELVTERPSRPGPPPSMA
jgi:hypothetical protein